MAKVAAEFNLSETAFLQRRARRRYGLRWFTPSGAEVDLCGHGTLAAAHALFEDDGALDAVAFDSRSGVLHARKLDGGYIELDFPKDAPAELARDADLVARLAALPPMRAAEDAAADKARAGENMAVEHVAELHPTQTRAARRAARE